MWGGTGHLNGRSGSPYAQQSSTSNNEGMSNNENNVGNPAGNTPSSSNFFSPAAAAAAAAAGMPSSSYLGHFAAAAHQQQQQQQHQQQLAVAAAATAQAPSDRHALFLREQQLAEQLHRVIMLQNAHKAQNPAAQLRAAQYHQQQQQYDDQLVARSQTQSLAYPSLQRMSSNSSTVNAPSTQYENMEIVSSENTASERQAQATSNPYLQQQQQQQQQQHIGYSNWPGVETMSSPHASSSPSLLEQQHQQQQPQKHAHNVVDQTHSSLKPKPAQQQSSSSNNNSKRNQSSQYKTMKTKKASYTLPTSIKKMYDNSSSNNEKPDKYLNANSKITRAQFLNLEQLLINFCQNPLMLKFSRPVTFLHPELSSIYSTIIKHPTDLGQVCRKVRRRQYKTTKEVRIDVWRIFSNCVKFHSDPNAKDYAIPSFISIALHLREYFNALWQEYMLPSGFEDVEEDDDEDEKNLKEDGKSTSREEKESLKAALEKREASRKSRESSIGTTPLSNPCIQNVIQKIEQMLSNQGRIDHLDVKPLFDGDTRNLDHGYIQMISELQSFTKSLLGRLQHSTAQDEYTVDDFVAELRHFSQNAITALSTTAPQQVQRRFNNRINRLLGKILLPIYEMSCRGVTQSSVWGCMAAAIWARESSKKRFWPALVLGILAPYEQREEWHGLLTDRNESRLPAKLAKDLLGGKRRAEQALNKTKDSNIGMMDMQRGNDQMSYFLVEFMGKHEFSWVREADIIENFDPSQDPNTLNGGKKRNSKSKEKTAQHARLLATAVEEGRWALEEFEMQLRDPCGDLSRLEAEEEEKLSYANLCLSDEETGGNTESDWKGGEDITTTDEDEAEELYNTEGILDLTKSGRTRAKKRISTKKKQKESERKKAKAEKARKEKELNKKMKQESKKRKNASKSPSTRGQSNKESKSKSGTTTTTISPKRKPKKSKRLEDSIEYETATKKQKRTSTGSTSTKERTPKKSNTSSKSAANSNNSAMKKQQDGTSIPEKKKRAEFIVQSYVHRFATEGQPIPSVMNAPSCTGVASYGLLGMALIFRAAAGELAMPENSADNNTTLKPWEKVDTDSPGDTSRERCIKLRKKIRLLKKGIQHLVEADERKKKLIESAKLDQKKHSERVYSREKYGRDITRKYSKARKSNVGTSSSAGRKSSEKKKSGAAAAAAAVEDTNNESGKKKQNLSAPAEAPPSPNNKHQDADNESAGGTYDNNHEEHDEREDDFDLTATEELVTFNHRTGFEQFGDPYEDSSM